MLEETAWEVAMHQTLRVRGLALLLGLALSCAPAADTADTADTAEPGDTGDTAASAISEAGADASTQARRRQRRGAKRPPGRPVVGAVAAPVPVPEAALATGGLTELLGGLLERLTGAGDGAEQPMGPTWQGDITILEAEDLRRLRGYGRVGGTLKIQSAEGLRDLTGLEDLRQVGALVVRFNDDLRSLAGLEGLRVVEGELYVEENKALLSLQGLEGLERVGVELAVVNNEALRDISAFASLRSVGADRSWCGFGDAPAVAIFHNDIASLDPLRGLEEVNGQVNLRDNGDLEPHAQQAFADAVPAFECEVTGYQQVSRNQMHRGMPPEPPFPHAVHDDEFVPTWYGDGDPDPDWVGE
jgi:hypothetical protein